MKIGSYNIDVSLIVGVLFVVILPVLLSGYGYDHFFNVEYSWLRIILLWILSLIILYVVMNLLLMIICTIWGKGRLVKSIVKKIRLSGDEEILNLGCSRGLFAIQLAKRLSEGKVFCIDIRQDNRSLGEGLDSLKRTVKDSGVAERIVLSDANPKKMSFQTGKFDLIINNLVLHEVKPYEEREKILKEMARVIKPGGMIIIVDLQYTREYKTFFNFLGWKKVARSPLRWMMFPPVRIVTAIKPGANKKAVPETLPK
ncbi:MAG: class I SAM-dependent methyltransferase [Chlamydiota bacterium]|nr:class I SAM-dependent methyltransferase [Chlamydiota bacterium]